MRTKFFAVFAVLAAFLIVATGCASFNAAGKMPDFNNPSSMDKTKMSIKIENNVSVAIYPLRTKEEAERYFDEDLAGVGILAIAVEVDCSTATTLTAATLVFEGGSHASPMSVKEIYDVMKRGYVTRSVLGWFFGLYIGAPILAYQTYKTNEKIQQDLDGVEGSTGKLLKLGEFPSGNTKGFLCFKARDPGTTKGVLRLVFQREGKLTEYNLDVN